MNPLLQYADPALSSLSESAAMARGLGTIFAAIFFIELVIILIVYIYYSLTLMKVAEKTKTQPPWLAWIPVGNLYLKSKIAKSSWWPILMIIPVVIGYIVSMIGSITQNLVLALVGMLILLIFAIILLVYMVIWDWKICEARGKPGWWVLITFVPFLGVFWSFIMWGILAWGK